MVSGMERKLSELMDGEIDSFDEPRVFDALREESRLRIRWNEFQLVGDALRGEQRLSCDLSERVMASLKREPVVLAPTAKRRNRLSRDVMAIAASAAGVAVVAWVALAPSRAPVAPVPVTRVEAAMPSVSTTGTVPRDMQEYLVAHQAHSGKGAVRGAAQHIRTVAATEYKGR